MGDYIHKGVELSAHNGNKIFLPAAGCANSLHDDYYTFWSSSLEDGEPYYGRCCLVSEEQPSSEVVQPRYVGLPIRPVCDR